MHEAKKLQQARSTLPRHKIEAQVFRQKLIGNCPYKFKTACLVDLLGVSRVSTDTHLNIVSVRVNQVSSKIWCG